MSERRQMEIHNDSLDPEQAGQHLDHTPPDKEWYALYVQVNHEKEVVKRLEQKEMDCFLPLMETWSKRRDRRKKIQLPMFPGYVFVHVLLASNVHLTVVKTPGALSLLHNSQGPLSIPSYQIENLRTMINAIQPIEIHSYLRQGDWVHVVRTSCRMHRYSQQGGSPQRQADRQRRHNQEIGKRRTRLGGRRAYPPAHLHVTPDVNQIFSYFITPSKAECYPEFIPQRFNCDISAEPVKYHCFVTGKPLYSHIGY